MADIYNPWNSAEEQMGFVGPELVGEEGYELPGGSSGDSEGGEMAEMMEEALSVINSQAETIKKLMAMLSGDQA